MGSDASFGWMVSNLERIQLGNLTQGFLLKKVRIDFSKFTENGQRYVYNINVNPGEISAKENLSN